MPKFTKKTLNSGFASTDDLEENFDNLETFSDSVLSRDGTTPNAMNAVLDMNSNRIINVADPVTSNDAINLDYADNNYGGALLTQITQVFNDFQTIQQNATISDQLPSGGQDGDIWYVVDNC